MTVLLALFQIALFQIARFQLALYHMLLAACRDDAARRAV
jgi:hypothetical protein